MSEGATKDRGKCPICAHAFGARTVMVQKPKGGRIEICNECDQKYGTMAGAVAI